jgi:Holliday junction resolvase RusA-like endonuclease
VPVVNDNIVRPGALWHQSEAFRSAVDHTLILEFTIPGKPATKKTGQRIVRCGGFPKILQSKAFLAYQDHCEPYCREAIAGMGAIDYGVSLEMKVFLPNFVIGDHVGYAQSIFDILQHFGVVSDDKWISLVCPTNGWLHIDKQNPRVEITIRRQRHPLEDFYLEQQLKADKKRLRQEQLSA